MFFATVDGVVYKVYSKEAKVQGSVFIYHLNVYVDENSMPSMFVGAKGLHTGSIFTVPYVMGPRIGMSPNSPMSNLTSLPVTRSILSEPVNDQDGRRISSPLTNELPVLYMTEIQP